MDDILNQFFGGMQFGFEFGPGGPGRRAGRGEDTVVPYDVTLEDLYNGKTVKLDMEREVLCTTCKGYTSLLFTRCSLNAAILSSGCRGNAKPKKCAKCEGHGFTFVQRRVGVPHKPCAFAGPMLIYHNQVAGTTFGTSRAECTDCHGTGEVFKEKDRFGFSHLPNLGVSEVRIGARGAKARRRSRRRIAKRSTSSVAWRIANGSFWPAQVTSR
jgi:DnaJ family protein A protein 2